MKEGRKYEGRTKDVSTKRPLTGMRINQHQRRKWTRSKVKEGKWRRRRKKERGIEVRERKMKKGK